MDRWEQIGLIFEEALDRAPATRRAFVIEACAGDDDLLNEVASLLRAHEQAGSFMEQALVTNDGAMSSALSRPAGEAAHSDAAAGAEADASDFQPGSTIGRYTVVEKLASGGMGVIYCAYDPERERKVAIKTLRFQAQTGSSPVKQRARLVREAQTLAKLSHPNIVAVYDVGTVADQVFIAMELVEGSTLTKWLAEQQRPWREIVNMFVQAGRGLAAAHAAGILHRDFKPDNVLVGKEGRPRVLDFGLARALLGEPEKRAQNDERSTKNANNKSNLAPLEAAFTESSRLMGTPPYMAPEQLLGQPADHRTDQYSFCVALYQGLYGELPFQGQSIEALAREMSQGKAPAAVASQVPSRLRRVVLKGLRPEPAERYPSMDALLDELVFQATRTRRRFVALAVVAVVAVIAAAGGIIWKKRNAARPSVESIAILPLKNLGDASDEATVDGLSNGLTTTVAQLTKAIVISQNSAARYKTSPKSLQEIARELNVDAIVSASAKRSGSRIQISTQLTHVATGRQPWTKIFESEHTQLPMLQADIAAGLLAEMDSGRLTPEQEARLARLRSVKPEAYQACLKGWLIAKRPHVVLHWQPPRENASDFQKSIAYFQEAIREDPNYALAYVALADAYVRLATESKNPGSRVLGLTNSEASRLATEALMKALSLEPQLGEAHAVFASVKRMDWDWRAAEERARRAIELSPNDAPAHVRYALVLMSMNRLDEAIGVAKRAQRLDPFSADAQRVIAWWFAHTKQFPRSFEEWHKAIELEPNWSSLHFFLSGVYDHVGRYAEALAEAQRAYELSGGPGDRANIAHILAHLGKPDEAEKIIEAIKEAAKNTTDSFVIAQTYSALKSKEETLKWLEHAYEAHADRLIGLRREPDFDWLQSDPGFRDLVRRIGFPVAGQPYGPHVTLE